jgi:hypothetical protein
MCWENFRVELPRLLRKLNLKNRFQFNMRPILILILLFNALLVHINQSRAKVHGGIYYDVGKNNNGSTE